MRRRNRGPNRTGAAAFSGAARVITPITDDGARRSAILLFAICSICDLFYLPWIDRPPGPTSICTPFGW
jgi:hypothetical protein